MAILYRGDLKRGLELEALFLELAPDLPLRLWPDSGDPREIRYLVAWELPENLFGVFPNLEAVFCIGAGIDQIDLSLFPEDIPLVRMLDPGITRGVVEYAVFATLALHRNILDYINFKQAARWEAIRLIPAQQRRIGVMGLGNLGRAVASKLLEFDFPLYGWSRSQHRIENVTCYAGVQQLPEFLKNCDILICLLPLTTETQGILNSKTFDALPRGAGLINVGRGGHLCEEDLLDALDSGQLTGAIVDVMNNEPPRAEHPFWNHPRILLTPHIAAMTQSNSAGIVLLENIRRHQDGKPMRGVVKPALGY